MTEAQWTEDDSASFLAYAGSFVPERDEQMSVVSALVGPLEGGTFLDLCSGPGALSRQLLTDHPGAFGVALDASQTMLVEAARELADFGDRFEVEKFDLAATDWRHRPTAPHAVVSSLAVHHLTGPQKQDLYRDVHRMLAPGGALVLADLVEPVTERGRALARDQWNDWVRKQAEQQGAAVFQAFHALEWSCYEYPDDLDKPSRLPDQLDWLREAGFSGVDVYWMKAGHAIYGGVKPAGDAHV